MKFKYALFALVLGLFGCGKLMTSEPRVTESTPVASAYASCPKNLNGCTNEIICVGARTKPYMKALSPTYWSKLPAFGKYSAEAMRRKLNCLGYN